jgi:cyclopropane-fatty-acyl-phospholipid synthase
MFTKLIAANLDKKTVHTRALAMNSILALLTNMQNIKRSLRVGRQHYDISIDLFKVMLDKRLTYTCGYWDSAKTLDEAQEAKMDLVCRKIGLEKGMSVLDIGCGWGSFVKFAAERYGAKAVGVTNSKEQASIARKLCKGLPVKIRFQDYRQMTGKYDRVVSIGMFEQVGKRNMSTYMKKVHRCLSDDGLFLLHTIGHNVSLKTGEPWLDKYIFPGGVLPSIKQIGGSIENLFVMEDWHNFGMDYNKTLMIWHRNFVKGWPKIKHQYSPEFFRLWNYYLLFCAATFRARNNHLWQIVLAKEGIRNKYKSVR